MSAGLLGAVLAGGASRRFGSPKAVAKLHGRPLWRIASDRLRAVCPRVVLVANDPETFHEHAGAAPQGTQSASDAQLEIVPDRTPGLGPLGGLDAALALAANAGLDGVLALAVDMPWVPETAIRRLAEEFATGLAGKARPRAPRTGPPWGFEPLCAVYPVGALAGIEAALAAGVREAGAFARSQGTVLVECRTPLEAFRSVNAAGDLPPPAVSVVGNKNSGKTTLAVSLIGELARRGRRVMSAKHGHHFRLDTKGTDSWRHRHEGKAERVLLAGPRDFALIGDWGPRRAGGPPGAGCEARPGQDPPPDASPLDLAAPPSLDFLLARHLAGAEIVVAEGFRRACVPKIQIHRASAQPEPAFLPEDAGAADLLAVVTDRPELPWPVPVFDPEAPNLAARLAEIVEETLL